MDDSDPITDVIEGLRFARTDAVGCYLCGRARAPRRIPVGFGMQALVAECAECRLAFQTPRPSPEASRAYMNWRWSSSDDYVADRGAQMQRALQQVRYVEPYVEGAIRLADFGAGAGSFVRAALDRGWTAVGVEQSESARARAKSFYGVDLLAQLGNERYHVITMWDVVEHLRDPGAVLRMLGEHLTEDGLVFMETGNYENWRRLLEHDQWGLYLFDHQFYFSPGSLAQVLRNAGYQGFCVLDHNRAHPPRHPRRLLRHPLRSSRAWLAYAQAKSRWPAHGDINVMIAVARKHPGLTAR